MSESRFLTIGLPGSGKTTFVAALWHVVESGSVNGALRLAELPTNRTYLNEIKKTWTACNAQVHTPAGTIRELTLKLSDGEKTGDVVMPDISGESFEEQWSERHWSKDYDGMARGATGALLFVHPGAIGQGGTIGDATALARILESDDTVPGASEKPTTVDSFVVVTGVTEAPNLDASSMGTETSPFAPKDAPSQVKLVDLLQLVTSTYLRKSEFKVAVVVSAWDLLTELSQTPAQWVEKNLPFLQQFLDVNLQYKVFGVSAFGGRPEADAERLRDVIEPSERIRLVGAEPGESRDITLPIRWLLAD